MGDNERELPEFWVEAPIGDLCTLLNGRAFKPIEWRDNGVPIIRIQNLKNPDAPFNYCDFEVDERFHVKKGDLLFAWSGTPGTSFGAHIWEGSFAFLNQHIFRVVFSENLIDRAFFKYALNEKLSEIISKAQGGVGLRHITKRKFEKVRILLPPFNEQKRIVAKIEELQDRSRQARGALETVPDLLEQLRQSILSAAFKGDLTRKWREQNPDAESAAELLKRIRVERRKRWEATELEKLKAKGLTGEKLDTQFATHRKQYKEPEPVDTTDLPQLPDGWSWTNLNQLKFHSIYGPRFSNEEYSKSGVFVLRTTDIDDSGRVNTEKTPQIDLSPKEFLKYKIDLGDLLITRTGSIGTLAVYNDEVEAIPGAYLLHYRLAWDNNLSWILFYQLKSPRCQYLMTGGSTGTGRPNLNAPSLEKIPLALPPAIEQLELLDKINDTFEVIELVEKRFQLLLKRCEFLEQSIFSKAFRGEMVAQDPNDDPASVLLECIRREKARHTVEQKTKPRQRGKKMKDQKIEQRDILTILQESARAMTPEELFAAAGFGEDSVDTFYEQLRTVVSAKKIRETRKGDVVRLEAAS